MAQRLAWQSLAQVLAKHWANAEADVLLNEAVVVKDLGHRWLLLGVGEQQLHASATATLHAVDAIRQIEDASLSSADA